MNKQLAKEFYTKSFSRWAKAEPILPEVFMQLVVEECIRVIENTKGPSKIIAIQNIKQHFGLTQDQNENI